LVLAVGLAASVLAARILGPRWKGALTTALLVPNTVITIGLLGTGTAATYFLGQRRYPTRWVLDRLVRVGAALGAVCLLVAILIFLLGHESLFVDASPGLLVVASLTAPVGLWFRYMGSVFLGMGLVRSYNLALIVQSAAELLLYVLLLVWPLRGGVTAGGAGYLGSVIVAVALSVYWIRSATREKRHRETASAAPRTRAFYTELFGYGFRAYVSTLVMFLNYRVDMYMLRYFRSDVDVGIYSVSVNLAELLWFMPAAFGTVLLSRSSRGVAGDSAARSFRVLTGMSVAMAGALALVAPWGLPLLYGREYMDSVLPFQILLAGIIPVTGFKVLNPDLAGRGSPGVGSLVFLGALLVNVLLNLWWIPRWGAAGAALASAVSYTAGSVVFVALYSRTTHSSLSRLIIPSLDDARWTIASLAALRPRRRGKVQE
jgi:O-antigen/teichoic acid export membrane protein